MPDFSKCDIYLIINGIRESYSFSVQDTENTDEIRFHYYLLTRFDNIPVLKRLNNTIEMINSGKLRLQKISSERLVKYLTVSEEGRFNYSNILFDQSKFLKDNGVWIYGKRGCKLSNRWNFLVFL